MSERLLDKTCLVTAANQGIGLASARAMHAEGATVWATDIELANLEPLAGDRFRVRRIDVTDPDSITRVLVEIGTIDVLFNCAGFVDHGTILECDEERFAFSMTLNVTGMYRMLRAVLPVMLANGGGAVINMSSVASSIIGAPNRFVYGTSKAAVVGMTKSIATDFVSRGVRCNCICPGTVESPSLEERMRAQGDYAAARKRFVDRQPMGRIGLPEEVAALVVYLASDESAYTTGVAHVIDGGWSVN